MLLPVLSRPTTHRSVPFHPGPMLSRSHLIPSHRNLVLSHPIPRKSGPVRSHPTKILVPSHPIPQKSHPIPVPRRDGTVPGRDILILAVSLMCFSESTDS